MKLKLVSWEWINEHKVSIRHIREPVYWGAWWYVDGRYFKRIERRDKKLPRVYGFGEPNGKTL